MTYSSLGAWLATVTAIVALGLWAGVPMTLAITALILVGIVPAAIVFRLFGRRDEQTVAEMGLRQ